MGNIKYGLVALLIACSAAVGTDSRPTEASVRELLEITKAKQLVEDTRNQTVLRMKSVLEQAVGGQTMTPELQSYINKMASRASTVVHDTLTWDKLEPLYIRIYRSSFTQDEVNEMLALYRTPAGQVIVNKMPKVLNQTMTELQPLIVSISQEMAKIAEEVGSEIEGRRK